MFELNTDVDVVLTKNLLLEKKTEEEYFSFYLGFNPKKGKYYKNPLRSDNSAGCKFFRNKNKELVFHDFSIGKAYTFVDVVMEKFSLTYTEALAVIANDFGIKKIHRPKNVPLVDFDNSHVEESGDVTLIQCETKEYTEEELNYWKSFGISKSTLEKFNVYSIKHVFVNNKIIRSSSIRKFIFGYYFGVDENGLELWKIYMPFSPKGEKFLCNTRCIQGLRQLPQNNDLIIVTKSYKDVMSLYELGISAIATQGESMILKKGEYNYIKNRCKYVGFNGDWDRTGINFMLSSLKNYDGFAISFSNKKKYAKDISDYICKFGFEKGLKISKFIKDKVNDGTIERKIRENRKKYQKEKT